MQVNGSTGYRMCVRCVMDTSDPEITFDQQGVCSHCARAAWLQERLAAEGPPDQILAQRVAQIRSTGAKQEYDCLIGVSGGVDSTYTAWLVKSLGLRPLAVHFDGGWNSEAAVSNIEHLLKRLEIDLQTYVVDWEEMRDLQVAFFKASVANADIPQDHAFLAVLWRTAAQRGIRWIISGHNFATESILPRAWGYNARDLRHLRAIHRRFGSRRLRSYPTLSAVYDVAYCRVMLGIRTFPILDYVPYVKRDAMAFIERELGWRHYGGKHHESIFTRFFQAYYLPRKFGFDKRRAHLSSLIVSGQATRAEALQELEQEAVEPDRLREDLAFVLKKLRLTEAEWEAIMRAPVRTHRDFPSNAWLFDLYRRRLMARAGTPPGDR